MGNKNKDFSKRGLINLSIILISKAIIENIKIEDNIILSSALYIIEDKTGLTLNLLKQYLLEPYSEPLDKMQIAKDLETMSIREVANKLNRTEASVRSFVNRQNIGYKRIEKKGDIDSIAREIQALNGLYSYTAMSVATHHRIELIKEACNKYNIPHK